MCCQLFCMDSCVALFVRIPLFGLNVFECLLLLDLFMGYRKCSGMLNEMANQFGVLDTRSYGI
uniref:Uncharacterized protein n=1 Tax=Rhizophora mucronata TaxID=61149 RepID=A0A2P2NQZ9_RHIMU